MLKTQIYCNITCSFMEVDGSDVEKTIFAIFIRNVILTQANC